MGKGLGLSKKSMLSSDQRWNQIIIDSGQLIINTHSSFMKARRTVVFFDVEIGRAKAGRIKMELWSDRLPHTCENFRQLCTGELIENQVAVGFKETCFYSVSDEEIRGGDYVKNDGSGGKSIFGEPFCEKTEYEVHENTPWILSMVKDMSTKKYTSIFQINKEWKSFLEIDLVPFGEINDEMSIKTVKSLLGSQSLESKKPKIPIIIYECGQM